jgi:hypothetical protein
MVVTKVCRSNEVNKLRQGNQEVHMNNFEDTKADARPAGGCQNQTAIVNTRTTSTNATTEFQNFVSIVIDHALENGDLP